jgi:hypothetical protein
MYTREIYRAAWALVREYGPERAPQKAVKRLQREDVRPHTRAGGSPIGQLIARCFGWYRANPPGEPEERLVVWNDALEKWFHGKRAWNSAALYSLRHRRKR